MKCLNCGCKDLFPISIIADSVLAGYGGVEQLVDAYACKKCGHVELFVPKEVIDEVKKEETEKIENEKLKVEYREKIEKLENEIQELKTIINDENQTVKTVKQAKEKLINKQNELNAFKNKLNKVDIKLRRGSFLDI